MEKEHQKRPISSKSATIYDIAKAANVSSGTISRFINGVGVPRAATKERIEKAIAEYNYVPNKTAQALKSRRSNVLCLALPELNNPFYFQIMSAVEEIAYEAGYSITVYHTHGDLKREMKILKMGNENIADGIIMFNMNFTPQHLEAFYEINYPLVISSLCTSPYGGTGLDNYDYVGVDTRNALYLATSYFLDNGHKNIAFVGGDLETVSYRERFEGYNSALISAHIQPDMELCFFGGHDKEFGYKTGKRISEMPSSRRPTAVCAINDITAIGLMNAFRDCNIKIPSDIAVIGLDNIDADCDLTPRLSSIDLVPDEIARCAVNFFLERVNNIDATPAKKIVFQPKIIIRESSISL